ncbi:MAG: hypothetical protein DWQ01_10615 [Planctomycetota bacterium]|nr:MAG: hypothetical protein DWQ01_10615 [Planctomycetota bacterium]
MRIDLKTAQILTSEDACATMDMLRNLVDNPLSLVESLEGLYPKKVAKAMAELMQLRCRAVQKFSDGMQMFFTKEQLEQSSSEKVAAYRAKRYKDAGFEFVHDACCGIGSDSTALARTGLKVLAYDKDESTLHYSQANAAVRGVEDLIDFHLQDVAETVPPEGPIFVDPARRRGSRRIMSPDDWSPNPEAVARLLEGRPGAGLKLSPSVPMETLLDKFPTPDEVEVISLHGENKAIFFWYGEVASGEERRATKLPGCETVAGPLDSVAEVGTLGQFVFDPDPSLVISGLLGSFAKSNQVTTLDPQIAYLTGDQPLANPFVDTFKVLGQDRLDTRKMRKLMRELEVGRLAEVRKRGIPDRALTLQQRFLPQPFGERTVTLIATRVGDAHIGIVGEKITQEE